MASQTQVLEFDNTQPLDGDQPYIDVTIATPYATAAAYEVLFGISVADGYGPIVITIKESTVTDSAFRVLASAAFEGFVTVTMIDV